MGWSGIPDSKVSNDNVATHADPAHLNDIPSSVPPLAPAGMAAGYEHVVAFCDRYHFLRGGSRVIPIYRILTDARLSLTRIGYGNPFGQIPIFPQITKG